MDLAIFMSVTLHNCFAILASNDVTCVTEQTHNILVCMVCVMAQDLLSHDIKIFPEKSDAIIYAILPISLCQIVIIFRVSFLSLRKVE